MFEKRDRRQENINKLMEILFKTYREEALLCLLYFWLIIEESKDCLIFFEPFFVLLVKEKKLKTRKHDKVKLWKLYATIWTKGSFQFVYHIFDLVGYAMLYYDILCHTMFIMFCSVSSCCSISYNVKLLYVVMFSCII